MTEPVGVPIPCVVAATVAVKVTAWPYTVVFIEEDSAVVVPAWATLTITVADAVAVVGAVAGREGDGFALAVAGPQDGPRGGGVSEGPRDRHRIPADGPGGRAAELAVGKRRAVGDVHGVDAHRRRGLADRHGHARGHLHHPAVAGVGDEDVARAVHRHARGVNEPGADGGLGAVGLHLHHPVVAGVGDEDVARLSTATPTG